MFFFLLLFSNNCSLCYASKNIIFFYLCLILTAPFGLSICAVRFLSGVCSILNNPGMNWSSGWTNTLRAVALSQWGSSKEVTRAQRTLLDNWRMDLWSNARNCGSLTIQNPDGTSKSLSLCDLISTLSAVKINCFKKVKMLFFFTMNPIS